MNVNDTAEFVWKYLADNPHKSIDEIAAATGLTNVFVKHCIDRLGYERVHHGTREEYPGLDEDEDYSEETYYHHRVDVDVYSALHDEKYWREVIAFKSDGGLRLTAYYYSGTSSTYGNFGRVVLTLFGVERVLYETPKTYDWMGHRDCKKLAEGYMIGWMDAYREAREQANG